MIGGVLVNFLLAMFIYSMVLFAWGDEYLPTANVKYGIMCDSLALNAGFQNGDKIISVDSQKIEDFGKIVGHIVLNNAKSVQVDRNGELINITLPESLTRDLIKSSKIGFITPRYPYTVGDFMKNSPAKEAGIKVGDRIVKFNDLPIKFFDEFKTEIVKHKNQSVEVGVLRGKDTMMFKINIPETGIIGVYAGIDNDFFEYKKINYSFFASFPAGISKGFNTVSNYLKQFKLLFDRKTKAYESLGGFITIGKIFPGVWDWQAFWNLTAFLSIILAVMNILPIPALDGGHVLFLLYEIVTGRKPSDKFLEYAQIAGMVLLFSLLIYANGNDIVKLFHK
jgi:regulator of sigma E protease